MPRQDPAHYMATLRIFECDLDELTDVDHAVGSVENLSLRSATPERTDDGVCFWQAPYPCYVEHISFDTTAMAVNGTSWRLQVVPFTFQSEIANLITFARVEDEPGW